MYLYLTEKLNANPSQTHVKNVNKYVIRNYYCYVDFIVKKAKPCHLCHIYRNMIGVRYAALKTDNELKCVKWNYCFNVL